ncbi:MAG TPA: type II secretion system protein GspM [Xanthobacteraceae bacterium]|jgi:general secretion pathway protein M|nr:type II secretion system protein GspM [Xanthobacteraceae bacterium]
MNISFAGLLARFPAGAAILYFGLVMVFAITAWTTVAEILDRRDAVAATAAVLSQLEGRNPAAPGSRGGDPTTAGSPLLEGATVTIGGANLLQRVAGSVARFGGNILYTQVDLQGTQSKDGFVSVTVSCEVEQPSLQQLLYDLEAGMPFLFVDQLVAQGPAVPGTTPEGKLRVLISVSGQWQGSK